MPGQRRPVLDWPYTEGLRLDEAMHPLTILAVGLYGEVLPNQNGAPIRLVVPWKYGFKSIKSIVRIRFVGQAAEDGVGEAAPNEYGFYSNVNPEVDHPRWSQARERRIGEFLKRPTLNVQRLRRPGGVDVRGDGFAEELLMLRSVLSCPCPSFRFRLQPSLPAPVQAARRPQKLTTRRCRHSTHVRCA